MSSSYYNEGVGHGAFVATFSTAGTVILENFSRERAESHRINQSDAIGAPLKWAGVAGFVTGSATAQLPVVAGNVIEILPGDQFTAPTAVGGGTFVVTSAGEAFAVGDYWKASLQLQLRYN